MILSRHNSTSSPTTSPGAGNPVSTNPNAAQDEHLDVRLIFEQYSLDDVHRFHRKLNFDVERKKEELRMLVGERYRDFIDAADVIGTMKLESMNLFSSLTNLRTQLNSLPHQLTLESRIPRPRQANVPDEPIIFTKSEIEIALELKLLQDLPTEIYENLEIGNLVHSFHYFRLFVQVYNTSQKKFEFEVPSITAIRSDLIEFAENGLRSRSSKTETIAEFMIIKQILSETNCENVIGNWLTERKVACENIVRHDGDFTLVLISTLESIYQLFLDPELYIKASKSIRKPNPTTLPISVPLPKSVQNFYTETILIDEAPKITRLAEIIQKNLINSLGTSLHSSFGAKNFLNAFGSFAELNNYRKRTLEEISRVPEVEELSRLVIGTGTNLWNHLFQPVFQLKAQDIAKHWIQELMIYLETEAFPKFLSNEKSFDLIKYIWKSSTGTGAGDSENELKMKGVTPGVSGLCEELELKFNLLWKDFETLDDVSSSSFISKNMIFAIEQFVDKCSLEAEGTGRFFTGFFEYVPSFWKLLEKHDSQHLKQVLIKTIESCWTIWSEKVISKFSESLEFKLELSEINITRFMPVAELYKAQQLGEGEAETNFEPSIRVPIQLNHNLHNLLFNISLEIGKVGPQSIPKSILNDLRISLGKKVVESYEKLDLDSVSSQTAVQLIFDLKFIQWLHSNLSGCGDELIGKLRARIDPFDWDILNPKLTVNMKRFLFENHLTLGLLFSEESHGFIAQNFKTRHSQSYPTPTRSQLYMQLPLLPL